MYKYYNPNPAGKLVGDCVIRGVSNVTEKDWNETYTGICLQGFDMKDMPSSNVVWANYLVSQGFGRTLLDDSCPLCYRVKDFCNDHPYGIYLLATGSHVVAVRDGNYYDAWDSGEEVPLYYWSKKGKGGK